MQGHNYVSEIMIRPGDDRWNSYKNEAAAWLNSTLGESDEIWDQLDVPVHLWPTLGFKHKKHKRMFDLWSEMQGVPTISPKEIVIIGGDFDRESPLRISVNL